jgi:ribonucleoside-diphosphate reductase alpha chain
MSISKEQLKWGLKPKFNSVDYLRVGDYVQIPNNKERGTAPDFNISDLFGDTFAYGDRKYIVERDENKIKLATICSNNQIKRHAHWAPQSIKVDNDFAYFMGLWYGDGCVFGENRKGRSYKRNRKTKIPSLIRGITFTFGSHERKLVEFVCNYLTKKEITFDLNENDHIDGTTQIVVHSPVIGYAFESFFGRRFDGKKLHPSMFNWPKSLVESLTQGLIDSDGTIAAQGDIRVVLSNPGLISGMYHILRSKGLMVGYSETADRGKSIARLDFGRNNIFRNASKKTYSDSRILDTLSSRTCHSMEIGGELFVEIREKTPVIEDAEYVYTFGVDEDHSYSVEGLVSMNCYVIDSPNDSYGSIFKADQESAQIYKRRGGCGMDISNLRPRGMRTRNAARTTEGIGIFMERFSNTCREVGIQGRRGALLLTIDCHHPEIRTFINIKKDLKKVTGANISIRWSDEFLAAVENGEEAQLRFPVGKDDDHIVDEMVDAKTIWDEFVASAHATGEPGCMYWDTVLKNSPSDIYAEQGFRTISANPCGEVVMNQDSCRLLLLNLLSFVDNPFTPEANFNFDKFHKYAGFAQRLMDDLVDIELEKINAILSKIKQDPESNDEKAREKNLWEKFKKNCIAGRRTGTGVTAVGDTLAALGIKYGSDSSIAMVEEIYKVLSLGTHYASAILAKERGAFPLYNFEQEVGHPFIEQIWDADPRIKRLNKKHGRRNIAITTTAPCGSVSILTQTSSGIEPVFLLSYTRRKKVNPGDKDARVDFVDDLGDSWQEFAVHHHGVDQWQKITGKTDIRKSPYFGATANEIDWVAAVDLQAAAQKWVCHAISKTINLPEEATAEQIHAVYWRGWKAGLKGITVYRDGCRSGVLVSEATSQTDHKGRPTQIIPSHAPKRTEEVLCEIHHAQIKGIRWTILIGLLKGAPYEVFVGHSEDLSLPDKCKMGRILKRKQGCYDLYVDLGGEELIIKNISKTFSNSESAWATRIISVALRHGAPLDFVVEQLQKDGSMGDINRVVSRLLKKYIRDGQSVRSSQKCENCGGASLVYEEGCLKCVSCGSGKCG